MFLRSKTFAAIALWTAPQASSAQIANPSDGTSIVLQESLDTYPSAGLLSITSNIPVNIQRYADVDAQFLDGSHPVSGANVQVVVTTDCDTPVVPTVNWDNVTGSLEVKVDQELDVSYLDPSWYQALWSYTSYWADYFYTTEANEITFTGELEAEATEITLTADMEAGKNDGNETALTASASTVPAEPSSAITTTVALSEETASDDAPQDDPTSEQSATEEDGSPSFTFRKSFLRQTITTFMVLYAINVCFVEAVGHGSLLVFGKVAVAAIGISTLFTKTYVKQNRVEESTARNLQTCRYNLDILIDGCYNSLTVNAPAGRVIDATMVNLTSEQDANDTATTDYSAVLQFLVSENNTELEPNTTVPSVYCEIIAEGRPFIDTSGKSLQASSIVEITDSSWLGYLSEESSKSKTNLGNETKLNINVLGEEWTRRALAEHASVASFSAFSIALMTNQAPSTLVNDALNAALDEVRHAKVSFDIASLLTGKEVGPGPLPASKLDFQQDLTALALAVSKEGCVDETLSAFSAALEADEIHDAIYNDDNTKFSGVNADTLMVMRDELIQIAIEESSHSALAWRTLNWVCTIDSDACKAAHEQVFDKDRIESRINQIMAIKHPEVLRTIQKEWEDVFVSHKKKLGMYVDDHEYICENVHTADSDATLAENTIKKMMANIRCSVMG